MASERMKRLATTLRGLADKAEAGEVVDFAWAVVGADGRVEWANVANETYPVALLGALTVLADELAYAIGVGRR